MTTNGQPLDPAEGRGDHSEHPRLDLLYKAWGLLQAAKDHETPPEWHAALDEWLTRVRVVLIGGED